MDHPLDSSVALAAACPAPDQPVPDEYDLLCESCGYSLVGLMTERCPECGEAFDAAALPLARVPWLYRKRLGRLRAYVKTAWMILRRPGTFAEELRRPVRISAADAYAFRKVSVRLVPLTASIVATVIAVVSIVIGVVPLQWEVIVTLAGIVATVSMPPWLWMAMGTDMPTFIWRGSPGDPTQLAPIHHYASAPLALTPLLLPLAVIVFLLAGMMLPEPLGLALGLWVLSPIPLLLWWVPLHLMHATTRGPMRRTILLALYLPVHWFLLGVVAAAAFGAVVVAFEHVMHVVL